MVKAKRPSEPAVRDRSLHTTLVGLFLWSSLCVSHAKNKSKNWISLSSISIILNGDLFTQHFSTRNMTFRRNQIHQLWQTIDVKWTPPSLWDSVQFLEFLLISASFSRISSSLCTRDTIAKNMLCLLQCLLSPPDASTQGNPLHLTLDCPSLRVQWEWSQRESNEQSWREILIPCLEIKPGLPGWKPRVIATGSQRPEARSKVTLALAPIWKQECFKEAKT